MTSIRPRSLRRIVSRAVTGGAVLAVLLAAGFANGGVALAAGPGPAPKPPAQVVVKVDRQSGYSITDVEAKAPVTVTSNILASRGIYLVTSTDPRYTTDAGSAAHLADVITKLPGVVYAEPNYVAQLDDTQYHAWDDGSADSAGTDPDVWRSQPAVTQLNIPAANQISTGSGVTIAVLDTGADASQSVLAGHLVAGWNYVEDNANTDDVADQGTSALGHGTFVAGTIALVAPTAKILPERVLDSRGIGNIFVVAQAIMDATNEGADIINLSFGTSGHVESHVLDDAIKYATSRGAVIVAAAGNDGSNHPHYPASNHQVVSVSALTSNFSSLASFADFGPWVAVAAPGSQIAGPVPGGGFAWWSGTSMATPFVAGQAALLRSAAPTLPAQKLTRTIEHTARKLAKAQLGFGTIDLVSSLQWVAAHPKG
jgi:subtilisin family serine protease